MLQPQTLRSALSPVSTEGLEARRERSCSFQIQINEGKIKGHQAQARRKGAQESETRTGRNEMEKAEASAGWHPSQEHMGNSSTPSAEVGLQQVPGQPGLQREALTSKEKGKRQRGLLPDPMARVATWKERADSLKFSSDFQM